jgi:hypothetical protein
MAARSGEIIMVRIQLARALLALSLGFGISESGLAATEHAHGHDAAPVEMTLNNGQRWPTDEALRRGMSGIRSALASSLPRIHERRFTPHEFSTLASRVQAYVDDLIANCKLPEAADLQLHVALAHLLDGIAAMEGGVDQEKGVLAIVQALNAYGEHFDHPGWEPLAH